MLAAPCRVGPHRVSLPLGGPSCGLLAEGPISLAPCSVTARKSEVTAGIWWQGALPARHLVPWIIRVECELRTDPLTFPHKKHLRPDGSQVMARPPFTSHLPGCPRWAVEECVWKAPKETLSQTASHELPGFQSTYIFSIMLVLRSLR